MGRRRPYGVHMTPSRLLTRPRPSPRRGTERGQASGEFAGILLVAGLLAGSLGVSATTWGEEISDGVICAIQSSGGEGDSELRHFSLLWGGFETWCRSCPAMR